MTMLDGRVDPVAVSNPRWLIDGAPATTFVYGRTAEMAVDVTNTPGTEIVFRLSKTTPSPPLSTHVVVVPSVGSTPVTVKVPVTLAHQWQVLEKMPTTFSYFNQCSDAGHTLPYQTNAWYLADQVTDDLLYPPLKFTAGELLQQPVTSPVISRELPQYIPGNSVDILVDGQRIKASVLQAIRAAQHHIHLNWFFFDTKSEISVALQVACERGVEVRLLFDWVATAMPEPIGQGIAPGSFLEGMRDLKNAGVQVGRSSLLVAPLDNIRDVSDPEYRDRLNIQKEYAKALMLTHGGMAGYTTLRKLGPPVVTLGLPVRIKQAYDNVGALGQAGIGTPVLLGGCRDHTKLIIVDGKIAFCGGPNGQKYYIFNEPLHPGVDATVERDDPNNDEKWLKWHDCFVRYEGPAVRDAQKYFIERWAVNTGEYLSRTSVDYFPSVAGQGSSSIKVISNVPGLERDIAGEYLRMFRNATQKIHIENPYVTDDLIANYIAHAAQIRHLPVELIVPEKYLDFAIARDLMKTRWDALRAAGVTIYAYDNHMMHVKAATADDHITIVSSYNFAKSSAAQLFEHGVVIDDPSVAADAELKLFSVDRPVSRQIQTDVAPDWHAPSNSAMRFLDRIV